MALLKTLAIAAMASACGGAASCATYSEDLLPTGGAGSDVALPPADSDAGEGHESDAEDGNSADADEFGRDVVVSAEADATRDVFTPQDARDALAEADASWVADASSQPSAEAAAPESGCVSGNAVQLGGATYASVTRVVQDDFTIEAWVKMTHSLVGTYFWQGSAVVWADVSTGANDFLVSVVNDKLAIGVGTPDSAAQSAGNAAAGKWVHVAATRTKATGNITVFIDGVAQGSAIGNTNALNASATMLIGNSNSGSNGFVGELDELRIWNTVRTASEISRNMARRLVGNETGLVSYFRFDESSGPTAVDSSPTANHALFRGPLTRVPSTAPICSD